MLFFESKRTNLITACGGSLREEGNHVSVEFRGRRVYFCRPSPEGALFRRPTNLPYTLLSINERLHFST